MLASNTLEQLLLGLSIGLRMAKEHNVPNRHSSRVLIELCKLVLVELLESLSKALLDLVGQRLLLRLPVLGNKLTQFIGSLNNVIQRISTQLTDTGQRHAKVQRHMTKLELVASTCRKGGHFGGINLGHKLLQSFCMSLAINIELIFKQHRSKGHTNQLLLVVDSAHSGTNRIDSHLSGNFAIYTSHF